MRFISFINLSFPDPYHYEDIPVIIFGNIRNVGESYPLSSFISLVFLASFRIYKLLIPSSPNQANAQERR